MQSFANDYIEKEWYNFTIWTIESINSINIPNEYIKENIKEVDINNKIYLVKIKDFTIFSSNKTNDLNLDKELFLYIQPSENTFNINDYIIWKKIIFRSDILLFDNNFYSPLYYESSILDLFFDDKNNYIIYEGWIWYFLCLENNEFSINRIFPDKEKYFYSSLAFINPTQFKWNKNNISNLEKNIVVNKIKESKICNNILTDKILESNIVVNNNKNIFYYVSVILFFLFIFFLFFIRRTNYNSKK